MTDEDYDALRASSYLAVIRRAADGVERACPLPYSWSEGSWFYWTEGNNSCDCNRQLAFDRAGDPPIDSIDDVECGESGYLVLRFVFPDGCEFPGPDAA